MGALLLQLIGPLQAWGVQSHFTHRDTGLEPSKSGAIGLVCAALGKPRNEAHPDNAGKPPLAALAALRMGVRVDREGLVLKDYHTAQNVMKAGGEPFKGTKDTELSERFYLMDAAFLVGLEGDLALLAAVDAALRRPHWPLCLGRKACPPGEPVWLKDGFQPDVALEDALARYRRLRPGREEDRAMRLVIEDAEAGSIVRPDQPVAFGPRREFTVRRVRMDFCVPAAQREG
jgi:CRISPR system Cascade subunit CasD